jgi:hypothetical protein
MQNAQLTQQLGMVRVAGTLSKSTEVMKIINDLVRVPTLMQTMQSMAKEMMKAGIIDEVCDAFPGSNICLLGDAVRLSICRKRTQEKAPFPASLSQPSFGLIHYY